MTLGKIGARPMRSYSAEDYVQDGLVAMFDAKENAGWGVFNPSLKTWVDLTGHEQSLSYSRSNTVVWNGNFMKCGGWAYNTAVQRSYQNGITLEWGSPGTVIDRMRPSMDTVGGYSYPQTYLLRAGMFNKGPSDTQFNGIAGATSASRSVTMSVGIGSFTLYFNDVGLSYAVNKSFPKMSGSARLQIGQIANSANTQAHYYRIYNRPLSADEVAYNHSIDKARFGVP